MNDDLVHIDCLASRLMLAAQFYYNVYLKPSFDTELFKNIDALSMSVKISTSCGA